MNFTSIIQRLPTFTLGFVILFTLAFFFFAHEGLNNIDDFFYSHYAYQLQTGTFPATPDPRGLLDNLKERYLVFAPVALLSAEKAQTDPQTTECGHRHPAALVNRLQDRDCLSQWRAGESAYPL